MTAQQPVETWDTELDFRSYFDALARYKWLVIGITVLAVAFAALVSFMQSPSYESSIVVGLPAAQGQAGLGLSLPGYAEFAISEPVVNAALLNPDPLSGSYKAELRREGIEAQDELLVITASASTPAEALSLAEHWVVAFDGQVLTLLEEQLARQKAASELASAQLTGELTEAENRLDAMDQRTSLSLMGSRLSSLERELIRGEEQLRQLTTDLIPTGDGTLSYLEDALDSAPQVLSATQGSVSLPEGSTGAGVLSNNVTALNPVYLLLSQDLTTTRTRLVTNRLKAELLSQRIPTTREEIDQLREEWVTAQTERQRLSRTAREAEARYNAAQAELDRVGVTLPNLPELARAEVVRAPIFPDAPVAPQTTRNIALAAVMGVFLGMLLAFTVQWYRTTSPSIERGAQ
jgi:uncharacterized protein involved in exopolysaccharide biosynthesis